MVEYDPIRLLKINKLLWSMNILGRLDPLK